MKSRTLAALLASLVALSCTAARPAAEPPRAPSSARTFTAAAAPLQPMAAPVGVVVTAAPTYLLGAEHAAFPSLVRLADGTMKLTWRQGSDHYVARDGAILETTLDDVGRSPAPATAVLSGGTDYRDPSVSVLGDREYLTYFTGSAANPAEGAYVSVNDGPAVRFDGGLPYAATAAPVVKLPDGRLGATFYARQPGETLDKAYMAWSSDGGQTWTSNRILNPANLSTAEPWIVVDGNRTLFFARWGNTGIAVRVSLDSGATWDAPRLISQTVQMTGRPTTYLTDSGVQVMVYRALPSRSAHLAYSLDHGTTWTVGVPVMAAPAGPIGMTYAAMADTSLPGVVRLILGMELADGSSALYSTTLAVSVR